VHDRGAIEPSVGTRVVDVRPEPVGGGGRQRQAADAVLRAGAEAQEIGEQVQAVVVGERRSEGGHAGPDPGSPTGQRTDVERDREGV
jgi:hypothetical protein